MKKTHPLLPIFFLALFLRMLLPWISYGFVQMDEHWQVIEPANSLLGHAWSQAAEYKEGLRNWIYPIFVSLLLRAAEFTGLKDPLWINSFVRMVHGIISCFSIFIVYFSVKHLSQKKFALWAALFTAIWPYALYCGFHTHGEMFGALFTTAAVAVPLFLENGMAYILSGALFGIAIALKIDVAVMGLGFGIFQFLSGDLKTRFRNAIALAIGVLPFVFLVGYTDFIYWGQWFHSVLGHARANLVQNVGNQWGVSPWYGHFFNYFDIGGPLVLATTCFIPFVYQKLSRGLKSILFTNFFFIIVFSFVEHKEKRFMAPLVYTSQIVAWSMIPLVFAFLKTHFNFKSKKSVLLETEILLFLLLTISIHGISNAYTYLIKQPWWDRISAIRKTGLVPGSEIAISAQWPITFYLPRNMPSMFFESTDPLYMARVLKPYHHISFAADWGHLWPVENHGFRCVPWPEAKPPSLAKRADVPWTYSCVK